jgi:uncharacterized protein (TIGR02001 family)
MRKLLIFGALVTAAASAPAFAQDEVTLSGNVSLVSDYVWRNVTQSNFDAALQGGFDLTTTSGLYAGVWGSSVDFDDASDANLEVDFYGGYRFDIAGLAADVGVVYYAYPDAPDIDLYEIYGKLSGTFDAVTLGGSLNWDPDNETLFADVSASLALSPEFSVSGGYGAYLEGYDEFTGWNVGGAWAVGGVTLGLRYHDADIEDLDESVVFSIGRSM